MRGARNKRPLSLALAALTAGAMACGGSTEPGSGFPAAGRWDAEQFDSHAVPYSAESGGNMFVLDSAWHVISRDGTTRLFVAYRPSSSSGVVDTIDGQFRHPAGDDTALELIYLDSGSSGDPYPPSPVTLDGDRLTVEDGLTHLIDVYVLRQ